MRSMTTTFETYEATVGGLRVRYFDRGEGAPVLFLHGWGADTKLVMPLAMKLERLGSYRVIGLDLAGFGESDAPSQAWTVFDYAEHVMAFVDSLGVERFHVFGHSFGGRLSLILGAEHGERLDKIVLANSAGIVESAPLLKQWRLRVYKAVRNGLYGIGAEGLAEALRQHYNARYGSSDFQAVGGVMRETFVKVIQQDLRAYAERIQKPTLLFWGDKDEDTPLSYGRTFEQIIPDAGLVILEGAGHYSYLEQVERCAQVMHYFLNQTGEQS